jgi:hypothetical protein
MMDISRPASPLVGSPSPAPTAPTSLPARLRLPVHLGRPDEKEISVDVLRSIDPVLAEVPVDYIRDHLADIGPEYVVFIYSSSTIYADHLLRIIKNLKLAHICLPTSATRLPSELEVIVDDLVTDLPSHILAIVPRASSSNGGRRIALHLTHSIVLGTHCASLPPNVFDRKAIRTVEDSTNLTVPVIPLSLPHVESFPLLHFYLYTKNHIGLITSLIQLPPTALGLVPSAAGMPKQSTGDIAHKLARMFTPTALGDIVARTHGVWANACALGVYDDNLWTAIDFCWTLATEALKVVSNAQFPGQELKVAPTTEKHELSMSHSRTLSSDSTIGPNTSIASITMEDAPMTLEELGPAPTKAASPPTPTPSEEEKEVEEAL